MLDFEILLFFLLFGVTIAFISVFLVVIYYKLKKILVEYDNLQKNFKKSMNDLEMKLDSFPVTPVLGQNSLAVDIPLSETNLPIKSYLSEQQPNFVELKPTHSVEKNGLADDANNNFKLDDNIKNLNIENTEKAQIENFSKDLHNENRSLDELISLEAEIMGALKRLGEIKSSDNTMENNES